MERLLSSCGSHLGFCGAQPAADLVRDGGAGLFVGGPDHGQGLGRMVQIQKHIRLLPRGEGKQARVTGFAGGGGGALEVGPGAGQPVHVDGLPSGQRGGVGQGPGELLAVPGAQRVPQDGLDLADVGFQLACHRRSAQAAVQQPDIVGLALQDPDDSGIDTPGRGDLPEQVGILAGSGHRDAARL